MKTNINSIMDTVDEIKEFLSAIDKRLDGLDVRLRDMEYSKPCDCLIDIDMAKINDLIWEVQKLLGGKK